MITADAGGVIVAIAVREPLAIVGMLPDGEPFFEAETDELAGR